MSNAMELNPETLNQIGEYVKKHLPEWTRESATGRSVGESTPAEELRREIDIRERIVRVEEELKTQRELMREGFAAVDRRFEDMHKHTNRWMTLISIFLAVIGAMPWILGAY